MEGTRFEDIPHGRRALLCLPDSCTNPGSHHPSGGALSCFNLNGSSELVTIESRFCWLCQLSSLSRVLLLSLVAYG